MKIFFSHASKNKATVKGIINNLPKAVSSWLDEKDLLWGDNLAPKFEKAIKEEIDYLVIFVDSDAARSEWVHKELAWALEREKQLHRTFVLPIALSLSQDQKSTYFPELFTGSSNRKSIDMFVFDDSEFTETAKKVASQLFALICDDLDRKQHPVALNAEQTVKNADQVLNDLAVQVDKIVFKHRIDNPISISDLYKKLLPVLTERLEFEEFESLLQEMFAKNLLSGIYYDGYEMYLVEEHSLWKSYLNHEKKLKIARRAAMRIKSGMTIYLDAGSTTAEITKIVCNRLTAKTLANVDIVTPSVPHASYIANCCTKLGFDDDTATMHVYVPGGQVRPSTQALIPFGIDDSLGVNTMAKKLGGFDLAFIGANGLSLDGGITTHSNLEVQRKRDAFSCAAKRCIVCDSSKCGITLEEQIATWDEEMAIVCDDDPSNEDLQSILEKYRDRFELVN
ncbi:MAG: TIR domain-containing protein [Coriobacteriales bacterium]|nr:TIR domain-containing protein [Coriobacteriales bacterium]